MDQSENGVKSKGIGEKQSKQKPDMVKIFPGTD